MPLTRADGAEILAAEYRTLRGLRAAPAVLAEQTASLTALLEGVVYPNVEWTSDRVLAAVATDRELHVAVQRAQPGAVDELVAHNLDQLLPTLRAEACTGALDALGERIRAHRAEQRRADQLAATYLLPLRAETVDDELVAYVRRLADEVAEVIVVDASPDEVFERHAAGWGATVRHLRPEVDVPMGKVANVLTGLRHAAFEAVVIADDDVRWTRTELDVAVDALATADVVRPHNRFDPMPWHARWDTARTLLNRALDGDWPGTLVVRRTMLPDGYAGDALFENLELVRTVVAAGGTERVLYDLVVIRRPPSTAKFLEQRVRQAYDELARPSRLVAQLLLAPLLLLGRRRAAVPLAVAGIGLAEVGRRRGDGTRWWRATAPLWTPAWLLERAITSWLALLLWCRGGARFGGVRLRTAAHRHR